MKQISHSLDATLRTMSQTAGEQIFLTDAQDPQSVIEYNWQETHALVDSLAWQFANLPGRGIGVLLDNSYHCLCLIYGVSRAGKDLVLLDPEWGVTAKRAIVEEMALTAVVSARQFHDEFAELQIFPDFFPHTRPPFDATAAVNSRMIIFTSGTIGKHTRSGCFYRFSGLDTQDLAFFDERGGYHVAGRADNTINKGGNLFHLNECEQLLNTRDDVIDACCLKVPCELYGEDYIAVIQGNVPQENELMRWLHQHLGPQRAPRSIIFQDSPLPLNGAGKHDRRALSDQVARSNT